MTHGPSDAGGTHAFESSPLLHNSPPPSTGRQHGAHQPAVRDALSLLPLYTAQRKHHVLTHIRFLLSFPFPFANVCLKPEPLTSFLFQYTRSGHVASIFLPLQRLRSLSFGPVITEPIDRGRTHADIPWQTRRTRAVSI